MNGNISSLYGGIFLGSIVLLIMLCLICLPLIIVFIIGKWKLFKKAGKNGWEAIIPFYSDWIYVEIAGVQWWFFLIVIAGSICSIIDSNLVVLGNIASLFGMFCCNFNIAKKFNRDVFWAVILTICPFIVIPILGFSSKWQWDNSVSVSCYGPFNNNNGNNNSNENNNIFEDGTTVRYCANCGNKIANESKFCPNCGKEI